MTIRSPAGFAALAMLFGTLACAGNRAGGEEETAAARDTSDAQNPPGYRGMERDTTLLPPDSQATAVDTFLQQQGTGVPEDTAGYSGLEHPDTSMTPAGDTSGAGWSDTTGAAGVDTSGMSGMSDTTGQTSWDSTGQQ
jgi:hypothetical protein